ncbi:hypothetical protein [Pseudonocardia alaniniphila]|uniref:Uncharacterized protein n=1 Tax=Pseudonocardia alaniniphila TaxID=75291 RepID=A0ABS9TUI9_9PSEU|nr:hypothetical protein [Pseudonocardia alaniniphila]MCH6172229.1 hypothetical protein [Pseudonocardia alaniniphila]
MAELVVRCSEREHPALSQVEYGPETTISVAALLRREGRGPHAADRPLKPRGHSRPAPEHHSPSRRNARKAAAAAGALFAAGAVFSSAAVDTVASPRGDFDLATDPGGLTASEATVDRAQAAAPARPDRTIALTAAVQHVGPVPPGASGDGSISGAGPGLAVDFLGKRAAGDAAVTRSAIFPSAPRAGAPSILTLVLPEVRTPAVEVAAPVLVDLPIIGPVETPQVDLTEGRISAPAVTISRPRDGGVEVEIADVTVVAPDVAVTEVTAGLTRVVSGATRIAGRDADRDGTHRHTRSGEDATTADSPGGPLSNARAAVRDVLAGERDASALRVPAPREPDRRERAVKAERSGQGDDERTSRDRVRKAAESAGAAVGRLLGRT